MKFTILGSSGFIGSHLKKCIEERSQECFTPDKNHSFSKDENLGHVFYCIGLTSDFRTRPMETVKAHVCKLMEVLENSSFDSFLYLSSTRVYNGNADSAEETAMIVNPLDLSDLYNISKLMGEAICLTSSNKKIRVARLSNVIGSDFSSDNFLFALIKEAVDRSEIKLNVSLQSSKDYILVEDVVRLLELIAVKGNERIYNVSSGVAITNEQLVDEIKIHTNCEVKVSNTHNALSFPIIKVDKIKNEFSFEAKQIVPEIKFLVEQYKLKKHDSNRH